MRIFLQKLSVVIALSGLVVPFQNCSPAFEGEVGAAENWDSPQRVTASMEENQGAAGRAVDSSMGRRPRRRGGGKDQSNSGIPVSVDRTSSVTSNTTTSDDANLRRQVITGYQLILDRTQAEIDADTEGVDYWISQLRAGLDAGEMYRSMAASDEKFLLDLYLQVFKRRADLEGLRYYQKELSQGVARATIANYFRYVCERQMNGECTSVKTSQESEAQGRLKYLRGIVEKLYREVLGRMTAEIQADPGGVDYWTGQLSEGLVTEDGLRRVLVDSDEKFLRDLYLQIFKRRADLEGLRYYQKELSQGVTRAAMRSWFMHVCANGINGECR